MASGHAINIHLSASGKDVSAVAFRTLYGNCTRPTTKSDLLCQNKPDSSELRNITDRQMVNLGKLYNKLLANKQEHTPGNVRKTQAQLKQLNSLK